MKKLLMLQTKKALLLVAVFLLSGVMAQAKSYLCGTTPESSDLCALLGQEGSRFAACSLVAEMRGMAPEGGVEVLQTAAVPSQSLWQEAWESMHSSFIGKSIKLNLWISYVHPVGGGRQAMPADARRLCSACCAWGFDKHDKDNSSLSFGKGRSGYTSYNIIRSTVGRVLPLQGADVRLAQESGRKGQWEWIKGLLQESASAKGCGSEVRSCATDRFIEAPLFLLKGVPVSDKLFIISLDAHRALTGCNAATRVMGELNSSLWDAVTMLDASGVGLTDIQQMYGLADRTI